MHYYTKNIALKGLTGVLSLVLLMAVGQCRGPVEGGRGNPPGEPNETEKPNERNTEARLSLQVENGLVKLVNQGSEKVDLEHFSITTALTEVKDYEGNQVTGLSTKYVQGGFNASVGGSVTASIFAGGNPILEPGQEVAFYVQLNHYENVSSAKMKCSIKDRQGNEIAEQEMEWKSKLQAIIDEKASYRMEDKGERRLGFTMTLKNKHNEAVSLNLLTYCIQVFYGDKEFYTGEIEGDRLVEVIKQNTLAGKEVIARSIIYYVPASIGDKSMEQTCNMLSTAPFTWVCVSVKDQDRQLLGCTKKKLEQIALVGSP